MGSVLGLNDGDRNVRLVVEDVVGALDLTPGMQLAPDDDPAFGKGDFFPNLGVQIPARRGDGGRDEFAADVTFGKQGWQRGSPFLVCPSIPWETGC
jgi:hypothetical protein